VSSPKRKPFEITQKKKLLNSPVNKPRELLHKKACLASSSENLQKPSKGKDPYCLPRRENPLDLIQRENSQSSLGELAACLSKVGLPISTEVKIFQLASAIANFYSHLRREARSSLLLAKQTTYSELTGKAYSEEKIIQFLPKPKHSILFK
jgi:hypothetical protein